MRKAICLGLFLLLCQPAFAKTHPHSKISAQSFHVIDHHWFATAGGGVAFPSFGRSTQVVPNNSGFAPPANVDIYTTHQRPQPLLNLGLGQRFETGSVWLPAYSVGLYYQHFFESNIGNQILQYSMPTFTNYNFEWNLSSEVFLLGFKLNLLKLQRLMPYVLVGMGFAINKSTGYGESPLPGLTDSRVSPAYQATVQTQFAYNLGLGLDYRLARSWLIAAEYQFQNLGNYSLGHGTSAWAAQSLNLGTYRANTALLNLTYLFE